MDAENRKKWNYSFRWTGQHLSQQEMTPLRYKYDERAAAALARIQEISRRTKESTDSSKAPERLDLYAILRDNHEADDLLGDFWSEVHTVPDWVDWDQLARDQKICYRYAAANLTGFAFQGFIGENSVHTRLFRRCPVYFCLHAASRLRLEW